MAGEQLGGTLAREVGVLHDQNAAVMLHYALILCGSPEAAQDAVQEVFLEYFVARSGGQHIPAPKAWLFRTLRARLLGEKRLGASWPEVGLDEAARAQELAGPREPGSKWADLLWRKLDRLLTPRELDCVRLRAEGLQYDEIAETLGLRPGTVSALLARSHKKIRKLIPHKGKKNGGLMEPETAPGSNWT